LPTAGERSASNWRDFTGVLVRRESASNDIDDNYSYRD
jgi:hypothetical protein